MHGRKFVHIWTDMCLGKCCGLELWEKI